jgi:hypothetical protein
MPKAYSADMRTLIDGQPELTLDEVVCAMRQHKIAGSRTRCGASFSATRSRSKKALRAAGCRCPRGDRSARRGAVEAREEARRRAGSHTDWLPRAIREVTRQRRRKSVLRTP